MYSKLRPGQSAIDPAFIVSTEKAAEVFPTVRYFQIHFEFLQEQLQLTMQTLEALQVQIQPLEQHLVNKHQPDLAESRSVTEPISAIYLSRSPQATTRPPKRR
ncbi:MAG: hypothetical protein HOP23_18670 [Methylococcaceae bacterium]|nr:hypothetical protein [Methylococcaceae bacterium]